MTTNLDDAEATALLELINPEWDRESVARCLNNINNINRDLYQHYIGEVKHPFVTVAYLHYWARKHNPAGYKRFLMAREVSTEVL